MKSCQWRLICIIRRPQPTAGGARRRRHCKQQAWTNRRLLESCLLRPSVALCFGVARPRVWRPEGQNLALAPWRFRKQRWGQAAAGRRPGPSFNSMAFRYVTHEPPQAKGTFRPSLARCFGVATPAFFWQVFQLRAKNGDANQPIASAAAVMRTAYFLSGP